jgi:signal transduction histidine kinase
MTIFLKSALARRYSLLFILVFSIMGFTYLAISLFGSHYYLKQVQTQVHQHIADTLVQDHHLVEQGRVNQDALATTFKRYMLLNPYLEIYLVNRNGQVLQYSADDKKILRRHIEMTPLLTALSEPSDAGRPFPMGDDPRKAAGQAPFSVAALPDGLFLYVIIRNSIEQEANRQLQESLLLELSAWSFLVSLLVGLILGGGVFWHLTRRLVALSQSVEQFKDHPEQPIQAQSKPHPDDLDRLQTTLADMSQQLHRTLTQLEDTDRQRRFMISSLSHDLRTPLTNLLGYMEQASQTTQDAYLDIAYENGLKLKHYLDQLFDFAKLELESFQLRRQSLSLSELCFDILQHYQHTTPERTFKADIQPGLLYEFDPDRLESAIRNLLDNAVKYGQGTITLSLKDKASELEIAVRDQGEPLDEAFQTYLSHPFAHQTASPPHRPDTGSGLGLQIVKTIAEKHGGRFEYRSGIAHSFVMILPLSNG